MSTSWYNQSQMTKASEDQAHKAIRAGEKVEEKAEKTEAVVQGKPETVIEEKMETAA